jgi:hypothetical protein
MDSGPWSLVFGRWPFVVGCSSLPDCSPPELDKDQGPRTNDAFRL